MTLPYGVAHIYRTHHTPKRPQKQENFALFTNLGATLHNLFTKT